jgi:lipopolysaccharide biosynthesis protein
MLKKIRSSDADIIGLTANNEPKFHIQSFFLVFNNKIINDNNFKKFMSSLWQFPTKEIVIDFYEIRLTQLLSNLGYKTETIYPTDDLIFDKSNAVVYSLKALLARGFPYIKTSVSTLPSGKEILEKFLPSEAYKASKNNTKIL